MEIGFTESTTELVEGVDYTVNPSNNSITLTNALGASSSLVVTYDSESSQAKAFTFGSRRALQTIGPLSYAEGYEVVSAGFASHAEGSDTEASGSRSHAEGYYNVATGMGAHAEGIATLASGDASHAEGHGVVYYTASGMFPFAPNTAEGFASHAEGHGTYAKGDCSHAANYYTQAMSNYQTVIGKNNVADENGNYAFIIGNGYNADNRQNALTVNWNGEVRVYRADYNNQTVPSGSMWLDMFTGYDSDGQQRTVYRQVAHSDDYQGVQLEARRVVNGSSVYNGLRMEIHYDGARRVVVSDQAAWRTAINAVNKSGDTMTGALNFNSRGSNSIYNGPNDGANGVGGALNNLVISSWFGVSFTTACTGQTYTGKTAVSIDCRHGTLNAATLNCSEIQRNGATFITGGAEVYLYQTSDTSGVRRRLVITSAANLRLDKSTNGGSSWTNGEVYFSKDGHTHSYLPLSGGTITGAITSSASSGDRFISKYTNMNAAASNNGSSSDIWCSAAKATDKFDRNVVWFGGVARAGGNMQAGIFSYNYNTSGSQTGSNQFYVITQKNGTQTYAVGNAANFRSAIGAAASSDRRLKTDIQPLGDDAVDFIRELEPSSYWINGEKQVGLIAQNVKAADRWGTRMAFETVEEIDGLDDWEKMPDGSPTWKLDYIRLLPPTIAALQKALDKIDLLEARISDLELQLGA